MTAVISTTIDLEQDVWDEEVIPSSPRGTTDGRDSPGIGENRRNKRRLFIDSDESDADDVQVTSRPSVSTSLSKDLEDIDKLFDMDEDEDIQIQAPIDIEQLRKEADARHALANIAKSFTQAEGQPKRAFDNDKEEEGDGKTKGSKARVMPKLDDERLLGKDGFPALVRETKAFKISGKGYEMQDLTRLLYLYQLWGHKMFPKLQFRETVERVEKLCHGKRLRAAMSGYRDAESDRNQGEEENDQGDPVAATSPTPNNESEDENQGRSSPAPEVVTSTAREVQDGDDWDFDAMLREQEKQVDQEVPAAPRDRGTMLDDDMDMFDEIMGEYNTQDNTVAAPTAAAPNTKATEDDDDDMWDAVRDMEEQEAHGQGQAHGGVNVPLAKPTLEHSAPPPSTAANPMLEEWDDEDLYV